MPKRTDLQSILILGSGPSVIGQAAEQQPTIMTTLIWPTALKFRFHAAAAHALDLDQRYLSRTAH